MGQTTLTDLPTVTLPPLNLSFCTKFLQSGCLQANWYINLNHILADLLQTHPYVHLIALDFSKHLILFVSQLCLTSAVVSVSWIRCTIGWLGTWRTDSMSPKFWGMLLDLGRITTSIVQGSVIGPTAFVLTILEQVCRWLLSHSPTKSSLVYFFRTTAHRTVGLG